MEINMFDMHMNAETYELIVNWIDSTADILPTFLQVKSVQFVKVYVARSRPNIAGLSNVAEHYVTAWWIWTSEIVEKQCIKSMWLTSLG